ncbi:MAG: FliM/FliN family flagellar motor switch protein [Planctomycetota bacterium]|jgi:flagellar motor switch protein FliM
MSSTPANDLSREKIQQLLAAVGFGPKEDTSQIESTDYDWRQPHYFSSEQFERLDDLTKEATGKMAEKFARFCNNDFEVTVVSTTEHFVAEFQSQALEDKQTYNLPFGSDQSHPYGLVRMPAQTAFIWATQLLGDSETEEESERDLSQLEESLLLDIASALLEAFSSPCETANFQPGISIIKKPFPLELQETEALCKITFQVKKADQENGSEFHILTLCDKLETMLDQTEKATRKTSAEDNSKAILDHIQQTTIPATAHLASTVITLEELMNLCPNDILLLDKRIDEPIDLIVDNRTVCYGRPAKSDGRHAIVITAYARDYQ